MVGGASRHPAGWCVRRASEPSLLIDVTDFTPVMVNLEPGAARTGTGGIRCYKADWNADADGVCPGVVMRSSVGEGWPAFRAAASSLRGTRLAVGGLGAAARATAETKPPAYWWAISCTGEALVSVRELDMLGSVR
ncbi:hypothetical protein GCM10010289_69240 [Streptomyces violascens]|nr:hypothetical protein GCM10010289_69240 [Streptomyces violascens]